MLSNIGHFEHNGRLGTRPLPFFHDGQLPNLWQLTDTKGMAQRFQRYFRLRHPKQRLRVVGCRVEQLYYRPEKSCKALYRIYYENRAGELNDQWFSAQMHPADKSFAKFSRAEEKASKGVSFWEPINFWPELDTIFWTFPHDPQLTQLLELVQTKRIQRLFAAHFPTSDPLPEDIQFTRLKMMPRKRCLLQFDGQPQFITKTYAKRINSLSKGDYAYHLFADVYEATKHNECLTVPKPLFYDVALDTYAQELFAGETPTATDDAETIERAAMTLAEFHQLNELPNLQPSQRTADLVTQVQTKAALLEHFLPYDRRLPTIANQLMLVAVVLGVSTPQQVPIHGAFRLNQLLGQNGRFAMLDLDDAGWGDPHLDVAECVASMLGTHFTEKAPLAQLQANADTFIRAYQVRVPWTLEPARLHGYIALSLFNKLVGAFRRLETAVFPKVDALLQLIEDHLTEAV
ncbi:MAG: aminoglycoside phosphotransferase family protein [Chloroflexota bacterium]